MKKSLVGLLLFFLAFPPILQGVVPDSTNLLRIDQIIIKGNEVTKWYIIERELPFETGDTIPENRLNILKQKVQDNLMNTGLFNFVEVSTNTSGVSLTFVINLEERWYLWPTFYVEIADRNFNTWWKKKDFNRLNYKVGLLKSNFRGRREEIGIQTQFGYEQELSLLYDMPYLNKEKTLGIRFMGDFYAHHHLKYKSENHKLFYYTDHENYLRTNLQLSFSLLYRPNIHTSHQFTASYYHYKIQDTILMLNPNYAEKPQLSFPYFSYIVKIDHRNYKSYPVRGFYADFAARKFGLPGMNTNYTLLKTTIRKYYELIDQKWFFAASIVAQKKLGQRLPYYLATERGLGYDRDFVRGMEYYVFDQTDWIYAKTNIKRLLLPQKIFNINILKNELFGEKFSKIPLEIYANVFYDAGYTTGVLRQESMNPITNHWQQGFGLGIDFVTYYDKVLRTELAINHKGEMGFFVHMIAPI